MTRHPQCRAVQPPGFCLGIPREFCEPGCCPSPREPPTWLGAWRGFSFPANYPASPEGELGAPAAELPLLPGSWPCACSRPLLPPLKSVLSRGVARPHCSSLRVFRECASQNARGGRWPQGFLDRFPLDPWCGGRSFRVRFWAGETSLRLSPCVSHQSSTSGWTGMWPSISCRGTEAQVACQGLCSCSCHPVVIPWPSTGQCVNLSQ